MFFDSSTTNILLMVGVVALFIIFVIVLMKLNPSTKTKGNLEDDGKNIEDIMTEKPKPLQTQQSSPKNTPPIGSETKGNVRVVSWVVEKPAIAEKPLASVEKPSIIVEKPPVTINAKIGKSPTPVPQDSVTTFPSRNKEVISKPLNNVAPKIENNHSSIKDCFHQFGYLRSLPKNAAFPDECFGCAKLVQCLINPETLKE